MAVFRAMFTGAMDWEEPTARNSNLLPVKAKGLVRLRSERSTGRGGREETPISMLVRPGLWVTPFMMVSMTSVSMSPR